MPLPDSAALSLQVNPNAVQSKPKRAMIVRMSAETLDALDAFPSHPPMSVDFGSNPGIYIADTFFPMRPQKEGSPHELFLRAASVAKPMAPLKLYANIIGKFMLERQLGAKVTDKVRQQTMVAKQQHLERKAILLDQPLVSVSGAKHAKRKLPGSSTVVKSTPPSEQLRVASSSTSASRKISPLPQNTPSSRANADVRRRLVHCLAISPRLAEDALRLVGGANLTDSARDDLLALLEDVAEQHTPAKKGDNSPRPWQLKPQTWIEVRPFEWPKLTESERLTMARQARLAFKGLKIPESDPAWDNVRYRATAPMSVAAPPAAASGSRSSTTAQSEAKRSAITSKEAKLKAKQDIARARGEIQVKDESTRATVPRLDPIKRTEAERLPPDGSTGAKTVASRRLPGSGYQAKKSPQPSTFREKSGTTVDPRTTPKSSLPPKPSPVVPPISGTHARKTIPMPPKPRTKEESDYEREKEYERQREREREKRAREKEKQREERDREQERVEMEKREKARQKERGAVERERRQREKERERERERQREREKEELEQEKRQREKERILKEKEKACAAPAFKRKAAPQDAEDAVDDLLLKSSLSKRRKLDDSNSAVSSSKAQDPRLATKPTHGPSPAPRLKMKRGPSPLEAPVAQERRATNGSLLKSERPSKTSGSSKPRRRSPIYTSSEDEGEISQPRRRNPSPPTVSDRSISSDLPPTDRASHHRTHTTYPPSNDHAALRALYQSQYANYLGTFSKVVAQKRKIEAILNGDSDAEMDVLDPEDLYKLSDEHKSLKMELEHIHAIYTQGDAVVNGEPTSD